MTKWLVSVLTGFVNSRRKPKPTAYIVPATTYEMLMDLAEDIELGRIFEERKDEKKAAVEVGIDGL